jgi:hypothetical protein
MREFMNAKTVWIGEVDWTILTEDAAILTQRLNPVERAT